MCRRDETSLFLPEDKSPADVQRDQADAHHEWLKLQYQKAWSDGYMAENGETKTCLPACCWRVKWSGAWTWIINLETKQTDGVSWTSQMVKTTRIDCVERGYTLLNGKKLRNSPTRVKKRKTRNIQSAAVHLKVVLELWLKTWGGKEESHLRQPLVHLKYLSNKHFTTRKALQLRSTLWLLGDNQSLTSSYSP